MQENKSHKVQGERGEGEVRKTGKEMVLRAGAR